MLEIPREALEFLFGRLLFDMTLFSKVHDVRGLCNEPSHRMCQR